MYICIERERKREIGSEEELCLCFGTLVHLGRQSGFWPKRETCFSIGQTSKISLDYWSIIEINHKLIFLPILLLLDFDFLIGVSIRIY